MNADWAEYLSRQGLSVADGRVEGLPAPAPSPAATWTDLSHYAVLRFEGEDTIAFLQGQLTHDARLLSAGRALLAGWCNAKGRLLATFLAWQDGAGVNLMLPREIAEPVRKRMTMFILRAKTKPADVSDAQVRIGVHGEAAESVLAGFFGGLPTKDYDVVRHADGQLIALPGRRFLAVVSPDRAPALADALSQVAPPALPAHWEWLSIRAGVPNVTAATQEAFVPQMVNLELIDGVSFKKGCYPGQEIVARMHYLGKSKRRMGMFHMESGATAQPGDALYRSAGDDNAGATVVNAAPNPRGGVDLLAVVLGDEHVGEPLVTRAGAVCQPLPLPYALAE